MCFWIQNTVTGTMTKKLPIAQNPIFGAHGRYITQFFPGAPIAINTNEISAACNTTGVTVSLFVVATTTQHVMYANVSNIAVSCNNHLKILDTTRGSQRAQRIDT
jgi:hypothetical protein